MARVRTALAGFLVALAVVAVGVGPALPQAATGRQPVDTVTQGIAVYRGLDIAANTSTLLMDANPARRGFVIQNQTTGNCAFKIGGAAATLDRLSFRLPPGASYETGSQHTSVGVVNVICVTAGGLYVTEF